MDMVRPRKLRLDAATVDQRFEPHGPEVTHERPRGVTAEGLERAQVFGGLPFLP